MVLGGRALSNKRYRVYKEVNRESKGFWMILLVLEGPVRMLNPWGRDIKEGVAAY